MERRGTHLLTTRYLYMYTARNTRANVTFFLIGKIIDLTPEPAVGTLEQVTTSGKLPISEESTQEKGN